MSIKRVISIRIDDETLLGVVQLVLPYSKRGLTAGSAVRTLLESIVLQARNEGLIPPIRDAQEELSEILYVVPSKIILPRQLGPIPTQLPEPLPKFPIPTNPGSTYTPTVRKLKDVLSAQEIVEKTKNTPSISVPHDDETKDKVTALLDPVISQIANDKDKETFEKITVPMSAPSRDEAPTYQITKPPWWNLANFDTERLLKVPSLDKFQSSIFDLYGLAQAMVAMPNVELTSQYLFGLALELSEKYSTFSVEHPELSQNHLEDFTKLLKKES